MKVSKYLVLFASMAVMTAVQAQAPAFPGAEGYARYTTTGGRGGKVIHVTNLNDSGTGSLRAALSTSGKRIIVFDVSGTIHLKSDLKISKGDVTIEGQTAPGDGITLADYTVQVSASNVIMRFIRVRRGNAVDINEGADACWGKGNSNIILDHCSFSWSIDEVSSFYDNRDFTMQWCTVAESLNNAGHGKGAHGYGGIWGGKNASFHHNLLAHHNNRCPRLNGSRYNWEDGYDKDLYSNAVESERVDLRNCVMYNWGNGNGAYGGMGGYHNIVNNYYKAGPATKNTKRVFQCSVNSSKDSDGVLPDGLMGRFYINGNYVTAAGSSAANYDWKGVISDNGGKFTFTDDGNYYGTGKTTVDVKLTSPIDAGEVTTHKAEVAFDKVLKYAGASFRRDTHDERYAREARNGTTTYVGSESGVKGIIDTQNDVGGFPALASKTPLKDSDGDGMPDVWEIANGLNPNKNDAAEYTIDSEKRYYTNIEVYCNSLVEELVKLQNADAIESVDEYFPKCVKANGVEYYEGVYTGIEDITYDADVVETRYYSIDGKQLAAPARGLNIVVHVLSNGAQRAHKALY